MYDRVSILFQNRVLQNSFVNGIGFFVLRMLTLLTTPLLVKSLGVEGYGLWKLSVSVLGMLTVFDFGMGFAIAKYIAQYASQDDDQALSQVFTIGLAESVVVGILLTLPLYSFAPTFAPLFSSERFSSQQVQFAIRIVSLGFIPLMLKHVVGGVAQGLQRYDLWNGIKFAQNLIIIIMALTVSFLSDSIQAVIIGTVMIQWLTGLTTLLVAFRLLHPWEIRFNLSLTRFREMFSFIAFTGIKNLGLQVFNTVDKLVVGAVLDLSALTYYSVIIGVAKQIHSFCAHLTSALMPAVSTWQACGDFQRIKKYFKASTGLMLVFSLLLGGGLFLVAAPFLRLWMGPEFARVAVVPFRVLILIYSLGIIAVPANRVADGLNLPWVNTIASISIGALTLVLIWLLGSRYGLVGAAWANAASGIRLFKPLYIGYRLFAGERLPTSGKPCPG